MLCQPSGKVKGRVQAVCSSKFLHQNDRVKLVNQQKGLSMDYNDMHVDLTFARSPHARSSICCTLAGTLYPILD